MTNKNQKDSFWKGVLHGFTHPSEFTPALKAEIRDIRKGKKK